MRLCRRRMLGGGSLAQRAALPPPRPAAAQPRPPDAMTAAPAGALATTGPAGGREAMAGGAGGADTMGGAERGCGTILRGSGRAGAAARRRQRRRAGAAAWPELARLRLRARAGAWRLARLCFLFLLLGQDGLQHVARLGDVREIDLGRNAPAERATPRRCRGPPRAFHAQNAREPSRPRDLQANWSGSCPAPRPSSANTSRICRLLTSISRARSLIRTLLIRLFSKSATQSP